VEQQSNVAATVSLASGIATVVLTVVTFCLGFVPIVSMCNLLIWPLTWLTALVALISGVVGWCTAGLMEGTGKGASIAGIGISLGYFALQIVMFVLVLMMGGLAVVLSAIGQS
jgi:hypothetical protein